MAKGDQRSEMKDSGKSVKADASMDCKLNEIYEALCCMLCSKLFEEATTVNLCLHTCKLQWVASLCVLHFHACTRKQTCTYVVWTGLYSSHFWYYYHNDTVAQLIKIYFI